MKKIILLLFMLLPIISFSQTDKKYMEGAITFKDGKVNFSKEFIIPAMTQKQIYETLIKWADKRFQPTEKMNACVLYKNPEEGSIAIAGEEYIIFSSTALTLDRARIHYQIRTTCETGKCAVEMTRIRYVYGEEINGGEKYVAEEWITDEWALNKSKTKLYPITGKFRRKTIDLKDELFKEIQTALGNKMLELGVETSSQAPASKVQETPVQQVTETVVPQPQPTATESPKATTLEASNEEKLIAQAVRMTITAGNDEQIEVSKEYWGGFGELFGKKVTFCLIDTQKTMGNMLMVQNETYKISFYSANQSQPTVVINCKKLMTQTINGEEAKKMSPSCIVGKSYNMYVGEILK